MHRAWIFASLALLTMAGPAFSQAPESRTGTLAIESNPDAAEALVDGVSWGTTPCPARRITVGSHTVVVRKRDYLPDTSSVSIAYDQDVRLPVELEPCGYLTANITPVEAEILVDDEVVGRGILNSHALRVGPHRIVIRCPNYAPLERAVTLQHGQTITLTEQLRSLLGGLQILSKPQSATVAVEPLGVTDRAPLALSRLTPGPYTITVTLTDHLPVTLPVVVIADTTLTVPITLQPCGYLTVRTDPPSADVYVDGRVVPRDSLVRLPLTVGEHQIRVARANYNDHVETVSIVKGRHEDRALRLVSRLGQVQVSSTPPGATVSSNPPGIEGITPFSKGEVVPGAYELLFDAPNNLPRRTRVVVQADRTETASVKLQPCGYLSVQLSPADAEVRVDGDVVGGQALSRLPLPVGEHQVTARRAGYVGWQEYVDLSAGSRRSLAIHMQPKTRGRAIFRSLLVPGLGQFYSERPGSGALFLTGELLAAGGVVGALVMNRQANDEYETAKEAYIDAGTPPPDGHYTSQQDVADKRAAMLRKWDQTKTTRNYVFAAAGALAGLHVLNVLDAAINFPHVAALNVSQTPSGRTELRLQFRLAERSDR